MYSFKTHLPGISNTPHILHVLFNTPHILQVFSKQGNISPIDCTEDDEIRSVLELGAAKQRKLYASGLGDHLRCSCRYHVFVDHPISIAV